MPAPGTASQELVLQQLEIQAQLVPGDRQGEADLPAPNTPSGPLKVGPGPTAKDLPWQCHPFCGHRWGQRHGENPWLWEGGQAPRCNPRVHAPKPSSGNCTACRAPRWVFLEDTCVLAVSGPQGMGQAGPGKPLVDAWGAHAAPGRATGTRTYVMHLQESLEHLCITLAGSPAG